MILTLTPGVAAAYPDVEIRLVVARGLVNTQPPDVAPFADLAATEARVAAGWAPHDETGPRIGSWHEAFRAFGTNPRRIRPSADALGRRLARTGRLPRINPAVDAYNLVSVTHGIPAGAFDLDRVPGDVEIRYATDGDRFTPLGEPDVVERPNPGEVVYASGGTVLTRHWNHRDADLTKVTQASRNVVFLLERVSPVAADALVAAQTELAELLTPHAEKVELATLDPVATSWAG